MDTRSYLKEYVRITLASIRTPTAFFREMRGEGKQYMKPLLYMLME